MQVKGIRSTDSATCSSVTDAVWAAMDSYKKEQLGYPANIVAMYFPWAGKVRRGSGVRVLEARGQVARHK